MDKRSFLKTSSIVAGGVILSEAVSCKSEPSRPAGKSDRLSNWAGNVEYSTSNVHYPKTVAEVQEVVKKCNKLRPLGSRHSFSMIADSPDNLVSLKEMNKVMSLDKTANTVTVEAGMKYGELAPYLHKNGYALPNLASLPHIGIAGACVTATHGSGARNGNLSTAVSGIEFVNASGDTVVLTKHQDGEQFYGAVVNLGAIGVITKVTLDLLPAFDMKQVVYRNLPIDALKNNFDSLQSKGYSVSLFTDWRNKNINEVWIKKLITNNDPASVTELFGAKLATQNIHPVEDQSAESVTEQLDIAGPWYERLPHFKMDFMPSVGKELQSEYFIPIEHAYDAMVAIEKLHEKISPHLFISEIRTIQEDNFWMSPCYKRTCVAIHTTWKQEVKEVMALLPLFEEQLAPFNPRPHWAKLFTITPSILQSRYEKLADFKSLVQQHDPTGKFRNEFLEKNLYGG